MFLYNMKTSRQEIDLTRAWNINLLQLCDSFTRLTLKYIFTMLSYSHGQESHVVIYIPVPCQGCILFREFVTYCACSCPRARKVSKQNPPPGCSCILHACGKSRTWISRTNSMTLGTTEKEMNGSWTIVPNTNIMFSALKTALGGFSCLQDAQV